MSQSQLPDAEIAVLKSLWEKAGLTARDITQFVYGNTSSSHIGTVQKLLQRLEKKRYVERDRSKAVHRFHACLTRDEVASKQLDLLAEKLADGSLSPFVTHLVNAKRLTQKERAEIRKLLDEED